MKVFFLSDLHLENDANAQSQRFISFLREIVSKGDLLILGGDIFDLLVGSKAVYRKQHGAVLSALEQAAIRGAMVYYLEGNHDFHFAEMFSGAGNIQVRTEDFELSAHGRKIWISHGDQIDREDRGYLFLRSITKNLAFKAFVKVVPGAIVEKIGKGSSGASRKYTSGLAESRGTDRIRKLYLEFARSKVRDGFQHVLVGHSHLRDQIPIVESGKRGEYINVGYQADRLPYAVLEEGSEAFLLKELG